MEAVKDFCRNVATSNQSYWASLVTELSKAVYQIGKVTWVVLIVTHETIVLCPTSPELSDIVVKEIIHRLGRSLLHYR